MGEKLDQAAQSLKGSKIETAESGKKHVQLLIHNFGETQAVCLADVTSQAGNRTGLWAIKGEDKEHTYRISTKYADGTTVRKDLKAHDLHRMLIGKTRRPKKEES